MTTERYISVQGYLGAFGLMLPIEAKLLFVFLSKQNSETMLMVVLKTFKMNLN